MRPHELLNEASRLYPDAWKHVDSMRGDRGKSLPDWPSWCFLPMAAWYAIVSSGRVIRPELVVDVGRLAALGAWRYSKGVYRFDADVYTALIDTVPSGEMPAEVLFRLPEWSLYIETPGRMWFGSVLHGFWVHLEHDINSGRPELRLLLDAESGLAPLPIHIGKWTLTEAVDRAIAESAKQAQLHGLVSKEPCTADEVSAQVYGLMSLVLYLCSDEPEIDDDYEPGVYPSRPSPRRVKGGWKLFAAKNPRVWSVAKALGEKLRAPIAGCAEDGAKRSVSPHLRRAHWHGFWVGPMSGERRFKYKWLPPIVVAPPPEGNGDR